MSADASVKEEIDAAVERAIGGDAALDDIEAVLDDAKARVAEVRAYREAGAA